MKSITKKAIIIKGEVIKSSHIPMDTNKKRWMGIKIQVANLSLLTSKAKRNTSHSLTSLFKNKTRYTSKIKSSRRSTKIASTKNKK